MWHVDLTSEQSAVIARLIERYLDEHSEEDWQVPFVRKHRALPLYMGWSETTGIKPSGEVLIWSTESGTRFIKEIDIILFRASLMDGVKRCSELAFLEPQRPDNAITCSDCCGTGRMQYPGLEKMVCSCGGVGWVDPPGSR